MMINGGLEPEKVWAYNKPSGTLAESVAGGIVDV